MAAIPQVTSFVTLGVHVEGLDVLMRDLKASDKELHAAIRKGLRGVVKDVVLADAKRRASAFADDGTYRDSMAARSRANGATWLIQSTDPAAGVKEYAHIGARTVTSKGTPLADARLAKHSGVGVPRRANPPRAMVPAVDDNQQIIKSRIEAVLEQYLGKVGEN